VRLCSYAITINITTTVYHYTNSTIVLLNDTTMSDTQQRSRSSRGRKNTTTLTTVKAVGPLPWDNAVHDRGSTRRRASHSAKRGAGHFYSHGRSLSSKPRYTSRQLKSIPMVMDCDNGSPPVPSTHVSDRHEGCPDGLSRYSII